MDVGSGSYRDNASINQFIGSSEMHEAGSSSFNDSGADSHG